MGLQSLTLLSLKKYAYTKKDTIHLTAPSSNFIANSRNLWKVLHSYDTEQKKAFLKFVTANDRAPPGGLGKLKFYVLRNGSDSDR